MSPNPDQSSRRIRGSQRNAEPPVGTTGETAASSRAESTAGPSVFVPAPQSETVGVRRWPLYIVAVLALVAGVAVAIMISWPRVNPRRLDQVERVAEDFLKAIANQDDAAIKRLGTVEEPPAIRAAARVTRDPGGSRTLKGSFAPLGELHARIESEFEYDSSAKRFTPKNAMGPAAETLDMLHSAKDDAEKSGLYKKMESGDPNDLFDAAEQFGKVFTQLAEGVLSPKRIVPTYKMLVEQAKPPLPDDVKAFALEVAGSPKDWDALLKRSFHTLKADGPFIYERAEVIATATDRLASSGDSPTKLRLSLVRFQLEGIDTGWKVVAVKRILPGTGTGRGKPATSASPASRADTARSPGEPARSLHGEPGPQ